MKSVSLSSLYNFHVYRNLSSVQFRENSSFENHRTSFERNTKTPLAIVLRPFLYSEQFSNLLAQTLHSSLKHAASISFPPFPLHLHLNNPESSQALRHSHFAPKLQIEQITWPFSNC